MKNKGFTLVELLAVIAILAILVIIALPNVLKMFNDSKKNAFMVQARKTANVAQEHTVLSSDKTFDCNSLLTGQKFKDCTATVDKNNQVSVNVLGSGTYENFLMVDVTPNADSGTFVDLSKLNTINIGEEKEFEESIVKNNKINEPTFKIMTADELVNIQSKIVTLTDEEKQKYKDKYNASLNNTKIENNIIKNTSSGKPLFAATMTLPAGKYKVVYKFNDFWFDCPLLTDDIIKNINPDDEECFDSLFTEYSVTEDEIIGTIDNAKKTTYYIKGGVEFPGIGPEITIKGSSISSAAINGEKNITLMLEEVSSYKDAGVSYNGKTLTGNDVFTYTNLKAKVGNYKYIYVVKTNQGVKVLRRYITVSNNTSEKCFEFNKETQEIKQYYYFENNESGGKKCPMDVVIPKKISGVQVKSIGESAFGYGGCKGDVVQPTSSINNKYEIKKVVAMCISKPIGITSVILPEGLEYIGGSAFEGNNLKAVIIPSSVKGIGYYAFADNQLQTVTFKGDKSKIAIYYNAFKGEKNSASVNAI